MVEEIWNVFVAIRNPQYLASDSPFTPEYKVDGRELDKGDHFLNLMDSLRFNIGIGGKGWGKKLKLSFAECCSFWNIPVQSRATRGVRYVVSSPRASRSEVPGRSESAWQSGPRKHWKLFGSRAEHIGKRWKP